LKIEDQAQRSSEHYEIKWSDRKLKIRSDYGLLLGIVSFRIN
jgi:hypothetical protein